MEGAVVAQIQWDNKTCVCQLNPAIKDVNDHPSVDPKELHQFKAKIVSTRAVQRATRGSDLSESSQIDAEQAKDTTTFMNNAMAAIAQGSSMGKQQKFKRTPQKDETEELSLSSLFTHSPPNHKAIKLRRH